MRNIEILKNNLIFHFDQDQEKSFLSHHLEIGSFNVAQFFEIINKLNKLTFLTQNETLLDRNFCYFLSDFSMIMSNNLLDTEVFRSINPIRRYSNLDDFESEVLFSLLKQVTVGFFLGEPVPKSILDHLKRKKWSEIEIIDPEIEIID